MKHMTYGAQQKTTVGSEMIGRGCYLQPVGREVTQGGQHMTTVGRHVTTGACAGAAVR